MNCWENTFRTAYYIAKNDRSFSDFTFLVKLQELGGAEFAEDFNSDKACALIVETIASTMQSTVAKNIFENESKIVILINDSTILSSSFNIFLKTVVNSSAPMYLFLDIFEVKGITATELVESLEETLHKHGFSKEWLSQNFVGFTTVGTHYMFGKKRGLDTHLKKKYPSIVTQHSRPSECEKEFRSMNGIIKRLYSNLQIENVSQLLFLILNGPPVEEFDATFFTENWGSKLLELDLEDRKYRALEKDDEFFSPEKSPLYELLS
jgi:hypothetical protein